MENHFELPVSYKGKELLFPGQLHQYGYSQKIEIHVNGVSVFFEKDEEGNWRALVDPLELEKNRSLNSELIQAVACSIEEVLK
jgi:hypothetical protein